MKELTLEATVDNMAKVTEFVEQFLDEIDCPFKIKMQLDIVIDEIFGNIAHYAYGNGVGNVTIQMEHLENPECIELLFMDGGIPYNPLEKENPDITLSAEERAVGGLGIYMVKKSVDEISYKYVNGKNQLQVKKKLDR